MTENDERVPFFFGSTVRYCTIISSYDTDITYFDIVYINSDKFRLNKLSLQFPVNFQAISKNVNNDTQSEEIAFKLLFTEYIIGLEA